MMIPGMGGPGRGDGLRPARDAREDHAQERQPPRADGRRSPQGVFEQECEALINQEKVNAQAIDLAENPGIIFLDEIDKIVASEGGRGPTFRGRACSAICCRSSKARWSRPATAT